MAFVIIAHRGASAEAPENTVAAFDQALALGFSHLELDTQLSADGEVVVIHDATLERTTNGHGPVAAMARGELAGLDAGSWFHPRFSAQRIPTLAEVLRRYRGRAHLHIELKSEEATLPPAVARLLDEHGWRVPTGAATREAPLEAPVIITSFHRTQLQLAGPLLPGVPLSWLVPEITADVVAEARALGIRMVCPRADLATAPSTRLARNAGLAVRTHGVRSEADLVAAYRAGAQGSTVNWPYRAEEVLKDVEEACR